MFDINIISNEEREQIKENIKIGIYRELHSKSLLRDRQLLELIEKGGSCLDG